MVGGNTDVKFLVSTQQDHNTPAHKWNQISSARSYLATRSHAQRRSKTVAIIGAEDEESSSRKSAIPRRRTTDGSSTRLQLVRIAPRPASANAVSKNLHEEQEHNSNISLQDLFDIFQPLTTSGEDCSQTSTEAAANLDVAPSTIRPLVKILENEKSTSPPSQIPSGKLQRAASPSESCLQSTSVTDIPAEAQVLHRSNSNTRYSNLAPFIKILPESTSTLYPFVRLPVEITTYEKSLIHFYLVSGRCWLLGTSKNARFCPAIALSRLLMQIDPIYVLAHIIIGELLLSKATKRPLQKSYYKRCAEIYNATNVLLLDEEVSTHKKMWTLIQLAMLEATAGRSDLQALHIKALDEFAEGRGGITALFKDSKVDCFSFVTSRLYAGPLVWAPIPILCLRRLEVTRARFMKSLEEIQRWVSAFRAWISSPDSVVARCQILSHQRLDTITGYLQNLIRKWRSAEFMSLSLETKTGAPLFGLSLARTFVECDCSPITAFEFLFEAQEILRCSTAASHGQGHELDDLHPAAFAYGISCTRSMLFADRDDTSREARISQTLSDAHKLLMLLTVNRRVEIVEWVSECIATVRMLADEPDGLENNKSLLVLDSQRLQTLGEEIDRAWMAANAAEEF